MPRRHREDVRGAGESSWSALGGFLRGQIVVAFFDATFIGIALAITGVPLALAVVTFFAASCATSALSQPRSRRPRVLVSQGFTTALITLGVILVVQQVQETWSRPWSWAGRSMSTPC